MAQIFKEPQAFDNHPQRWNHDLSHKIYGTFKAGQLYPVFTHLMQPSDSVRVDMAALLQFMPTVAPLQSNVRVIFHSFFQRLKNIHKDWPNFIEGLEEHELPFVLPSVKEFVPGSIHDYLDVPCCVVKTGTEQMVSPHFLYDEFPHEDPVLPPVKAIFVNYENGQTNTRTLPYTVSGNSSGVLLFGTPTRLVPSSIESHEIFPGLDNIVFQGLPGNFFGDRVSISQMRIRVVVTSSPVSVVDAPIAGYSEGATRAKFTLDSDIQVNLEDPTRVEVSRSVILNILEALHYDPSEYVQFDIFYGFADESRIKFSSDHFASSFEVKSYKGLACCFVDPGVTVDYFINGSYSYADFPHLCPYATKEFPDAPIRLKAYRYRVYESVYNAFYRNIHGNQPFTIEGVAQYNKYNTTTDSGQDDTHYELKLRNWELDAYTSALKTPQQGDNPPLVGVTATGRLVIEDDDGTRSTAQLRDLDGDVQGLAISQVNLANDLHRDIVMSLASSGFTINDLRETNALQKFLETNIRKGFRYVDFIKGHFGTAPRHAEMDMPEFVGGFSVKLDVGKVTNTNAAANDVNPNDVLGQFAGSAQAFGSSKHSMNYFADDYGYFQVIMCIVPDSAYSQVLPKDFLYKNPLDFPFPEFGHLGYQPITYEEFCPGECYKEFLEDDSKKLTDVFGYQRPQHERVWLPDRLHGQFLTTMNHYCVNRVFDGRPELGEDFLTIKPEDMTRVFTVTKADEDICFGQIAFSIVIKQPVPRIALPAIGR